MNDLIAKVKELEDKYRKRPVTPRGWAMQIIAGKSTLESVPEHMRGIVEEHVATHAMFVKATAERILSLPNGRERLAAFNMLSEDMRDPVKRAVHALREAKITSVEPTEE